MGKAYFAKRALFGPPDARAQPRRCIACRRLIVWGGDRCPDCHRALRQRHKRKRR